MSDTVKLKKFGDEVAIELAGAIKPLLGKEVNVELSHVGNSTVNDVESGLSYSCFCTSLKDIEDGTVALLLVKERDASILADLLIGQDGSSAPDKMTELHISAFGEVVHQIVEVLNKGAKLTFGSRSGWLVEKNEIQEKKQMDQSLEQLSTPLVVFSFGLFVQDILSADLLFCLSESVVSQFAAEVDNPMATAVDNVKKGVSSVNTQKRAGGVGMSQMDNESRGGNISLLLDVPLKLTVELGRTTRTVKEILALAPGSVVELDKLSGEAVDILVNEKLIAKGEVVVIDENFGIRITEILDPDVRLTAVQG
jgi:flagellar motor switch protein FliN/FliY